MCLKRLSLTFLLLIVVAASFAQDLEELQKSVIRQESIFKEIIVKIEKDTNQFFEVKGGKMHLYFPVSINDKKFNVLAPEVSPSYLKNQSSLKLKGQYINESVFYAFHVEGEEEVDMANEWRKNGKLSVVISIIAIIMGGILTYLVYINFSVKKLEQRVKSSHE